MHFFLEMLSSLLRLSSRRTVTVTRRWLSSDVIRVKMPLIDSDLDGEGDRCSN